VKVSLLMGVAALVVGCFDPLTLPRCETALDCPKGEGYTLCSSGYCFKEAIPEAVPCDEEPTHGDGCCSGSAISTDDDDDCIRWEVRPCSGSLGPPAALDGVRTAMTCCESGAIGMVVVGPSGTKTQMVLLGEGTSAPPVFPMGNLLLARVGGSVEIVDGDRGELVGSLPLASDPDVGPLVVGDDALVTADEEGLRVATDRKSVV
jgi:hypothetical protein